MIKLGQVVKVIYPSGNDYIIADRYADSEEKIWFKWLIKETAESSCKEDDVWEFATFIYESPNLYEILDDKEGLAIILKAKREH